MNIKKPTSICIEFEKRNLWIGVYYSTWWSNAAYSSAPYTVFKGGWGRDCLRVYICLIPCFPIILEWKN